MVEQAPDSSPATATGNNEVLQGIVTKLLADLQSGEGDRDKRRQVEDWMRSLAEKYPEFSIHQGLRAYYLAEAQRLREEFDKTPDLSEKLALGRSVETFLEKAREFDTKN